MSFTSDTGDSQGFSLTFSIFKCLIFIFSRNFPLRRVKAMAKRNAYSFTLAALIALMVGFAFQADAGLLVFDSRDSWQAALGNAGFAYNFNGFKADASFASSAINFGPFNLRGIGVPVANTDKVVTGPSNSTVDGSPFASMFLDSAHRVDLGFTVPALAFGAEFIGSAWNFGVFQHGSESPIILGGTAGEKQYFGIISTEPIDRIEFLYSGSPDSSTTVNFDNVGLASVPEPSSLMILGMGATLFAAYTCWRLRRGKIEIGANQV
jgi:hypothetical protein